MALNFDVFIMSEKNKITILISVLLCLSLGETAKLSVPRILLPYNTGVPTNYTLEVKEGGCYKW